MKLVVGSWNHLIVLCSFFFSFFFIAITMNDAINAL